MKELIEIVFEGKVDVVKVEPLIKIILESSINECFNSPEISAKIDIITICDVISQNNYVDFVATLLELNFFHHLIPNIFFNLTKDENKIELLLFFDLRDIIKEEKRNGLLKLQESVKLFNEKYGLDRFTCRMDNGDDDEYYFNEKGFGPLYYL